jgi:hypothetical protein
VNVMCDLYMSVKGSDEKAREIEAERTRGQALQCELLTHHDTSKNTISNTDLFALNTAVASLPALKV